MVGSISILVGRCYCLVVTYTLVFVADVIYTYKPYVLFADVSKHSWSGMLTQGKSNAHKGQKF